MIPPFESWNPLKWHNLERAIFVLVVPWVIVAFHWFFIGGGALDIWISFTSIKMTRKIYLGILMVWGWISCVGTLFLIRWRCDF